MRSGVTVGELGRGHWTPRQLVQLMTGADALGSRERERLAAGRQPPGRAGAQRPRAAAAPRRAAHRPRGARGRADRPGRPGGTRRQHVPRGAARRRRDRGRRRPPPSTAGRSSSARRPTPPTTTSPTCPRERRLDAVFSWMSIRENFALPTLARDSALRLAAHASVATPPALLHRPPRHRARLPRARDHDALGRQPAEGDHRALARVRAARAAAQRPHARHRHRRQERPVRAVRRAGGGGPGRGDALHRARRARRADGSRPGLPRARAVQGVRAQRGHARARSSRRSSARRARTDMANVPMEPRSSPRPACESEPVAARSTKQRLTDVAQHHSYGFAALLMVGRAGRDDRHGTATSASPTSSASPRR